MLYENSVNEIYPRGRYVHKGANDLHSDISKGTKKSYIGLEVQRRRALELVDKLSEKEFEERFGHLFE